MAVTKNFRVTYEVVKASGMAGAKYTYRKGFQQAHVAAASIGAVAGVLTGNLTLASGEAVEIIDIHEEASPGGLLT